MDDITMLRRMIYRQHIALVETIGTERARSVPVVLPSLIRERFVRSFGIGPALQGVVTTYFERPIDWYEEQDELPFPETWTGGKADA